MFTRTKRVFDNTKVLDQGLISNQSQVVCFWGPLADGRIPIFLWLNTTCYFFKVKKLKSPWNLGRPHTCPCSNVKLYTKKSLQTWSQVTCKPNAITPHISDCLHHLVKLWKCGLLLGLPLYLVWRVWRNHTRQSHCTSEGFLSKGCTEWIKSCHWGLSENWEWHPQIHWLIIRYSSI